MGCLGKLSEAPFIQSRSVERCTLFMTRSVSESIVAELLIAPKRLEIFLAWWLAYQTLEVSISSSLSWNEVDLPKPFTKTTLYSTVAFVIPRCRLWSSWLVARMWNRPWMRGGSWTSGGLHRPECCSMDMPVCVRLEEQEVAVIATAILWQSRWKWSSGSSFRTACQMVGKRFVILFLTHEFRLLTTLRNTFNLATGFLASTGYRFHHIPISVVENITYLHRPLWSPLKWFLQPRSRGNYPFGNTQ